MKLVISDTDSPASLEIAKNIITQWYKAAMAVGMPPDDTHRRNVGAIVTETKAPTGVTINVNQPPAPAEPKPLGPALSDPTEASNQPAPEKRGPGRPRKTADVKVAKTHTLDEVRARMIELARSKGSGMMDAQRQLLHQFGASNISALPIERIAEFMDKLETLQ